MQKEKKGLDVHGAFAILCLVLSPLLVISTIFFMQKKGNGV